MRKNHIIEMDNSRCKLIVNSKEVFYIKRGMNAYSKDLKSKEEIKNSKLKIILEGEEIFICRIVTPRVSKSKLYLIVRNEIIKKFRNMDNIIFDYTVFNRTKQNVEVCIYCVNASRLPLLNKVLFDKVYIKSIDTIQQLYIDYCNKRIVEKSYILLVNKGEYIYFLEVKENVLVRNRTMKYMDNDVKILGLEFLKEINECNGEVKSIYILGEKNSEVIKIAKVNEMEKFLEREQISMK